MRNEAIQPKEKNVIENRNTEMKPHVVRLKRCEPWQQICAPVAQRESAFADTPLYHSWTREQSEMLIDIHNCSRKSSSYPVANTARVHLKNLRFGRNRVCAEVKSEQPAVGDSRAVTNTAAQKKGQKVYRIAQHMAYTTVAAHCGTNGPESSITVCAIAPENKDVLVAFLCKDGIHCR